MPILNPTRTVKNGQMSNLAVRLQTSLLAIAIGGINSVSGCATTPPVGITPCTTPLDSRIHNGCIVEPQILWRGARPDTPAATALIEAGVRTLVNLELVLGDKAAFTTAVPSTTTAQTIQYFRVRDWEPLAIIAPNLTDDHVAHFIAITRTQAKPIYVHCRSGQNRTGVMVAAYKIFNGAEIEATVAEMTAYGGFWAKQDSKYLRRLTPSHRVTMEASISKWSAQLKPDARIVCENGKCSAG